MTIRVRMIPHVDDVQKGVSGIHGLVKKYFEHLPNYGIKLVSKKQDSFDLFAVHAGTAGNYPDGVPSVAHLHGLYWTNDYPALSWEWAANDSVVDSIRRANEITVPSEWVADVIRRDCRVNPSVVPHGVDWDEWQHSYDHNGYILAYAKNRVMDVCNPAFISDLAHRFPDKLFICTFAPKDAPPNVRITGLLAPEKMKEVIQRAAVVVSPIRETFGILTIEALAAGTPVLGYAYGGNNDLIKHGVDGYLAQPGNVDDLAAGLDYCLANRTVLGKNANLLAKQFTWDIAMRKLVDVYQRAMVSGNGKVSIVIPTYNYSSVVGRAIESALNQTRMVHEVIVVDDGSPDDGATKQVVSTFAENLVPVKYIHQNNAGVAVARNNGIANAGGEFIICLDADDQLDPRFVEACLPAMQDRRIGIAYTGLLAVEPDGKQSVSPWPPQFNFDNMVYPGGINSIPTACLFRKEMWRRLGGYRSRYCPHGAGSEDAEFWLRAGLHGYGAVKVTDAPLFIYSYRSGQVSGNKNYREIDWRGLHPSTKDGLHPFPCVATPMNDKPSHPVRQYDSPDISVIVPVGPGHKQHVVNALDSLEAQTYRNWEVILVDDTGDEKEGWSYDGVPDILTSYPYAKVIKTPGKKGAGYARNRGVEAAKARLIIFLDADDNFFVPEALERMLKGWNETGSAIYTDYISKAVISKEEALKLQKENRLLDYNEQTGLAMHASVSADFNCERAIIQPANPLYIWNLVTTLLPKTWHDEIGGFDENMPSWEDWEYWLRMARAGKCFARLAEPCVVYRFYTGGRRETGIEMPQQLLGYIIDKLEGVIPMPCSSCGKKSNRVSVPVTVQRPTAVPRAEAKPATVSDEDLVLCIYTSPNFGMHKVVGAETKTNYGYRAGGGVERFYVHKKDIAAHRDLFTPFVQPQVVMAQPAPVALGAPVQLVVEPERQVEQPKEVAIPDFLSTKPASQSAGPGQTDELVVFKPIDFQAVPGITDKIAVTLQKKGLRTWDDVVKLGVDGLMQIEGVGKKRAENIYNSALKASQ